jgi:hypothetical protein
MLISHLNKYMMNIKIKFLKEVYKKFGGLIRGKIFILNIIQKKINIGILIMLKPILQMLHQKINVLFLLKKLNKCDKIMIMA